MTGFVTPSTPVRRNRVHNIDTDRLRNRRAYLIIQMRIGAHTYESRMDFAVRAYELQAIENVLVARGHLCVGERRTVPGNARS